MTTSTSRTPLTGSSSATSVSGQGMRASGSSAYGKKDEYKTVLLGEGKVGKTSLMNRFTRDEFNTDHRSTVQACCVSRRVVVDGRPVTLTIWDTAGQEKFHALTAVYYRDASCAILVYDITDRDSFDRVHNWVQELRKMANTRPGVPPILIVIAGNKSDMERNRVVSLDEAEKYASTVGATHFSTSAKMNKNVRELFDYIARNLTAKPQPDTGGKGSDDDEPIRIGEPRTDTNDGGCC